MTDHVHRSVLRTRTAKRCLVRGAPALEVPVVQLQCTGCGEAVEGSVLVFQVPDRLRARLKPWRAAQAGLFGQTGS